MCTFDVAEYQGLPYIVMPHIPGGTLADYVRERGPLTLREAQQCVQQVADALAYVHQRGCVHCDVKPANILLDQGGRAVLADFGTVRFLQGAPLHTPQSLQSFEMLMGTPEYVSPEQALGEQLDARSDIYSLAVTLFYLLTGFPPFRSDAPSSTLLMHVQDTPPKLSSARADMTPRIDDVLAKALSKWPDDRYKTVGEFGRELGEAISQAAQTRTIDEVALTPSAGKALAANRRERARALQPVVKDKPLARRPFHVTRAMAIALALCVVLLGSSIVAALFYSATATRTNHTRSNTPQLTPAGILLCASSDAFPISGTFFCKGGKYYIQNTSTQSIALALYQDHTFANIRLAVTASEVTHSTLVGDYRNFGLKAPVFPSGG